MVRTSQLSHLCSTMLMSDLGLIVIVALYVFSGAYLFQYIEYDGVQSKIRQSVQISLDVEQKRADLPDRIWLYKWEKNVDYDKDIDKLLIDYQTFISNAVINHKYSPDAPFNETNFQNGWRFTGALLFTVTIVTTIGYGHIYPVTPTGQIAVILFALIGVPMNLGFLTSTGKSMANKFRHAYNRGCCYICWKQRQATFRRKKRQLVWNLKYGRMKNADLTKLANTKKLQHALKVEKFHANSADAISKQEANRILHEDVDVWCQFVDIMEHVDEDKNVPITLILVIIAVYLFIGSVLFSAWNQWPYLTSAYFSLVTLSTVGFGDIVPGFEDNDAKGDMQLVVVYAYIWFGQAVVSMCFNMMLTEMTAKGQWFQSLIGLDEKKKSKFALKQNKVDLEPENKWSNAFDDEMNPESIGENYHQKTSDSTVSRYSK